MPPHIVENHPGGHGNFFAVKQLPVNDRVGIPQHPRFNHHSLRQKLHVLTQECLFPLEYHFRLKAIEQGRQRDLRMRHPPRVQEREGLKTYRPRVTKAEKNRKSLFDHAQSMDKEAFRVGGKESDQETLLC